MYRIEMTGSPKKHGFKTKHDFLYECSKYVTISQTKVNQLTSNKDDYLITDDHNSNTQKMKDAISLMVKILTYTEFIVLLKHRVNTDPLKEVKKDIHNYLVKNGYDITYENTFNNNYNDIILLDWVNISDTPKSINRGLFDDWSKDFEKYDKYFLEFISPVLIKHKVKKIYTSPEIDSVGKEKYLYKSTKWTFDTIK